MQNFPSKKDIGKRIKKLRAENSLSQVFIANILKLSRSNYSQIELGNQYPSFNTLHLISRYYNKSYNWLLHGPDQGLINVSPTKIDFILNDLEGMFKSFTNSLKQLEEELNQIKMENMEISKIKT